MYAIVYVTASGKRKAETLCRRIVNEGLAACGNIFPIHSIYRWKGKIERSEEVGIFFKTREDLLLRLTERIKELHEYELPCIISWRIEYGDQEYLNWIKESTG